MPIHYEPRLTPRLCRTKRDHIVVFGDNLAGWGKAGQACIRGEPNALGIPTKRYPSMCESAFFTDADLETFKAAASPAFTVLRDHLSAGGGVIWPRDGIGTGLAQLERRAPRIWASLQRAVDRLHVIAREAETQPGLFTPDTMELTEHEQERSPLARG